MEQMLLTSTMTTVAELASMLWMEIAMIAVASLMFVLFNGKFLPAQGKKLADEDPQPELERVARELQNKLATGDFLAAYKLWQRAKSFDQAMNASVLLAATEAMRRLGRTTAEIVGEFKSAPLGSGEETAEFLDMLQQEGEASAELHASLSAAFREARSRAPAKAKQQSRSTGTAPRAKSFEQALEQLGRNKPPPKDQLVLVLKLACREHRLPELVERLAGSLDTAAVNALLGDAARSRDAALCRQAQCLGEQLGIPKDARTFELLARGLAADGAVVRALWDEAEASEAVSITEPVGHAFLVACGVCCDATLAERVFQARKRESGGSPDPASCSALLKACIACGLHERACEVYEQEMAPQKMAVDKQLGELLVKSATQAGRTKLAEALCECPVANDSSRHLAMVRACGREGNLEGAVAAFRRLQETGAALGSRAHNTLLDACAQCGDAVQALELFAAMKRDKAADVVSFNIAMKLLLRLGRVEEAREVLREMPSHGLQANAVTYNELLNATIGKGASHGPWEIIAEMQEAGVQPNAVTCSTLLKSLTRSSNAQHVDRVMRLIDSMEEQMDEVLFSSVVEACIRVGRLDAVAAQTRKFAAQGGLVALTAQTYGSLFKAYGRAHDVERLWELWNEMEQRQAAPTSVTVGCFVDALVMNGCTEDALDVVHRLLRDPSRAGLVNNIIFSTLLKGFAMTKQVERLFAVYGEMQERGVPCNTVTYNTMLDACARCGCMDKAPGLVSDMRAAGIAADMITHSTLAKGYCFSGDVDAAFSVLKDMKKNDLKPDEILYNSILDGCAKEHRVQEALDLFAQMRAQGIRPSNFTLCTLVKLLGRARQLPQAFRLLEELCGPDGLRPNLQVYTCLMTACVENRQLEKALQLHDTVIAAACQPDQKMYNALVRGCVRAGSLVKAAEVMRCAYLLPGHGFRAPSSAFGVDTRTLEELVMRLNQGGRADGEVARSLVADLKRHCGMSLQDSVYAQVVQRATRGAAAIR